MTKEESNFIKLVAVFTMLIDHIGAFLFPFDILRMIGRISFPLFAYQLSIGYKKTSSKKGYLTNLFIYAVISQIPYYLLTLSGRLNILFTLILGIFAIYSIEKKNYLYLLPIFLASFFVDYYLYGILLILIFYFLKEGKKIVSSFSFVTLIFSLFFTRLIQLFSIFSLFFILGPKMKINIPKYFFYLFYPVHLFLIYFLKVFFF